MGRCLWIRPAGSRTSRTALTGPHEQGRPLFLILIAVAVGMSMDTERQHHAADAAANEIRELNEKRRELIELNHRISKAIRVLTDRYQMLKQESSAVERCARCPYRKKDPNE